MSRKPASPLPQPRPAHAVGQALNRAVHAVASAWAHRMDTARHHLALRQLHSTLRDLGIAARALAYQSINDGDPISLVATCGFPAQLVACSRSLLEARHCLDGVLAAEGLDSIPGGGEAGAALCQAARQTITAWRQPAVTTASRDEAAAQLSMAVAGLIVATQSLADSAAPPQADQLHAVLAHLRDVSQYLPRSSRPQRCIQMGSHR